MNQPAHPSKPGHGAIRVMLCDDSATVRAAVARLIESDPAVRVTASARDGADALAQLRATTVDVVLLDIEMQGMDGLTALPLILRAQPGLRVIMLSALTTRGARATLRALLLGATDYIAKPGSAGVEREEFRRDLLGKLRGLARPITRTPAAPGGLPLRPAPARPARLLAIGSSTGGPQALATLLAGLGRAVPVPIVLTQHMPASFIPVFADQLTRLGGIACRAAVDGEELLPGRAYLAPGERHLEVVGAGRRALAVRLSDAPAENFCRPSVDPMLRSAAVAADGRVLVAMLTGMGHDGLAGTQAVIAAGGAAIAQDEASSVVWGMPGAIASGGLCHDVVALSAMPRRLLGLLGHGQ